MKTIQKVFEEVYRSCVAKAAWAKRRNAAALMNSRTKITAYSWNMLRNEILVASLAVLHKCIFKCDRNFYV
jgi:hypothetical protein